MTAQGHEIVHKAFIDNFYLPYSTMVLEFK